jgi:hypothetical protein
MRNFVLTFFVLTSLSSADIEVSDVNYESKFSFKGEDYVLNGAGIRERFFLDLYTIGLYLKAKSSDGNFILNSKNHKCIKITVVSSLITADRFSKGMNDGFNKSTNNNTDSIKAEIAELKRGFGNDFNVGDTFVVFFGSDGDTEIYKEDNLQVIIHPNKVFQNALLGMWIGDNPVVGGLKEDLLGYD